MNIHTTLTERGTHYGDFSGHAEITQNIKRVMQTAPKWDELSDPQREALEMVAHKIGRILNGNPHYFDSWFDCIGYLQLVVDRIEQKPSTFSVHP